MLVENLQRLPPPVRATVKALRRLVKEVAPTATETPYNGSPPRSPSAMWKLVRYGVEGRTGYEVGIGAFADHVSLFFPRGRELDDTGGLEGRGAQFRYLTLRTPADVGRALVKRTIRRAFALGAK
jgi:hypothetical protein